MNAHVSLALLFVFVPEDQVPHGFPTIDMGPQLKVVERTRTATMLCAASGNPDPEIFWFKDFLPVEIDSSNGRIKQLRSGNIPEYVPGCVCLCSGFSLKFVVQSGLSELCFHAGKHSVWSVA